MAISVSISLALVVAAVLGTLTPIVLKRLNVDPAVAAGPFVTTVIDLLGILVYFGVVSAWPGL
jgi:magnesium transporter